MCDTQLQQLTKRELIDLISEMSVPNISDRIIEVMSKRPPKIKSVTQKQISKKHTHLQPISVQSIMKECNRVIPTNLIGMGIKCKVVCTQDDQSETVGQFSEQFDDLDDILNVILGDNNTNVDQEPYKRYSDTVDYFLIYEIDVHVRESVCLSLKNTLANCYAYNVDMFNIVDDPNTPQLICILFMKMTIEEEFNTVFKSTQQTK